jgi:hypothetical protein
MYAADGNGGLYVLSLTEFGGNVIISGDVDCDGDVDSVDSLKELRHIAGLLVSQAQPCPKIGSDVASLFGDVDCDDDVDPVDSLKILRYVAALSVSQAPGCTPIGWRIADVPSATPTPTAVPEPTPSSEIPTGQAFNFKWYQMATEPEDLGFCDLSKPIPPNSPVDTGLCVTIQFKQFPAERTVQIRLFLEGELFDDSTTTLFLTPGPWHVIWPSATLPGAYFLEVFVDGVLVGTSTVQAP